MPSRLWAMLEEVASFIVSSPGHDQLMDSSQIGWLQGEISKIIPLLVSASSYGQQFSSGRGLLPIKTIKGCVRSLYLSGNCEFGDSAMWQNYSQNCYQFSSPTAILCFYVFTFPNQESLNQCFISVDKDSGVVHCSTFASTHSHHCGSFFISSVVLIFRLFSSTILCG